VAVALATGWARWRGAILHNELIVQGEANPKGLNYNGLLCNLALGVVFARILALVFERWVSSSLFFFQLTNNKCNLQLKKNKVLYLGRSKCQNSCKNHLSVGVRWLGGCKLVSPLGVPISFFWLLYWM
jgi:hypothetical protein